VPRFSIEFRKRSFSELDLLVQNGIPLTSELNTFSTPSNAIWKLTFSNSPSTLSSMLPTQWLPGFLMQYNYWMSTHYKCMFNGISTHLSSSITLSLQAQNLPFQQILPTVDFFYLLDCLMIKGLDRTYHAHHFILVSHFSFLFILCGRQSWLPVSFLLRVKYTVSYHISYHIYYIISCLPHVCHAIIEVWAISTSSDWQFTWIQRSWDLLMSSINMPHLFKFILYIHSTLL